jgi:hypothetical protein
MVIISNPNQLKEKFHLIKDQIIFNSRLDKASISCICCGKENHTVIDCYQLRYLPDIERVIKKA